MPISRSEIATPSGTRLINRLCKHWAHKLEVEHSEQDAKIVFPSGVCVMQADPERLLVTIEAADAVQLNELESVIENHAVRMVKGETLNIVWEQSAG